MTEPTVFLHFDQALDGQLVPDLDGAQPLIATAHMVQTLFDRQQTIPSEEFIMQLEATLFPTVVIPSGVEGSPAAVVSPPRMLPRLARIQPERPHVFRRWVVVAAVVILLLGGAGAIIVGPFHPRSTPEPSAIPAASFATAAASPQPARQSWTVEPPPGLTGSDRPGIIANGRIFRTFAGTNQSPVQAVELKTGNVLWVELPRVSTDLLAAANDVFLVAGSYGFEYELIALDGRTGDERWSVKLAQAPKGLLVDKNSIFVLGSGDLLEAFDVHTQERLWHTDLSRFGNSTAGSTLGPNDFSDLTGDRMTAIDGTVGAIVSSGRLVAIDAADGSVQWASERSTESWTRIAVVDGKFVVIAWSNEQLMYDPEATPIPMTPADPTADRCTLTIETRAGSIPGAVPRFGETVDSFDPETGASPWGLILPEQYLVWPVDESHLITQVEAIQSAGIADSGERFPCSIAGSSGAVSETTPTELATFAYSAAEPGVLVGVSAAPSGIPFWISEIDAESAKSLPRLDLDLGQLGGIRWVQTASGMILVTGQDGTLIGLSDRPVDGASTEATPVPADESASSGWTVPGPEGDHAESEAAWPVVDNGRIFRSFYTVTAANHTQAVDMATGSVVWDRPLNVRGEVMASSGERLLIGGRVGALLKDFSLVALDQTSGNEIWRIELSGLPKSIVVDGDRAFVLSADNKLDAVDLQTGSSIYTTDIGGESKPVDPAMATGSQHGMVIDGETLVAVLADGSVTGVDLESGDGRWWNLREWTGAVRVDSVADALIVTDFGDTTFYLPEESRGASGIATLEAVATPAVATCLGRTPSGSSVATPASGNAPNFRTTITRIDPKTGAVRWTVSGPGTFSGVFASYSEIYTIVSTAENWPIDRSQIALCAIDPRTGEISDVNDLSGMIESTFLWITTGHPDWVTIAGLLDNGEMFSIPAIFDPAVIGLAITMDLNVHGGTRWVEIHGNAIYISRADGQLEKIPLPAQ